MQRQEKSVQIKLEARTQSSGGPLGQIVAAVLGVVILIAAVFLSFFLFAGVLVVGVAAGGWFWWRTRRLRRQLRASIEEAERQAAQRRHAAGSGEATSAPGEILEGDYIRTKSESNGSIKEKPPIER